MENRNGYRDQGLVSGPAQEKMAADRFAGQCDVAAPAEGPRPGTLYRQREIERMFESQKPEERHFSRINLIGEAGKMLALTIDAHTPSGSDRDNAIGLVRAAVQSAVAGIVTHS